MLRLGLSLSLRGGREALTRLVVIMAAVAVGVTLLLTVFALYHGYDRTVNRPCWMCTGDYDPTVDSGPPPKADQVDAPVSTEAGPADLWSHSQDFYQGHPIGRVDVAPLGAGAPVIPGLTQLPAAGQYYASPALARLIASVPPDQLGNRFPGTLAGSIGQAGLSGPDDLAIVIGRPVAELASQPGTIRVTSVHLAPHKPGSTDIYQFGFGLGAVALLVPMLILVGNATRVAAARREERWGAMRLVGASSRQISLIAALDAAVGALGGAVLGVLLFLAVRPALDAVPVTGERFFPDYITPTTLGYVGVLVGAPLAAVAAVLASLRRIRISPLGVARRTTPPPPRAWRVIPLLLGLVLFIVPLAASPAKNPRINFAVYGLALIMIGLTLAGPWLAMQAARLLARYARGPASLLAARRMADNPKASFRFVSGLVLAVFVGTALAGAVPAALSAQQTAGDRQLTNVLQVILTGRGIDAPAAARLTGQLMAYPGVSILPVYVAPSTPDVAPSKPAGGPSTPDDAPIGPPPTIVRCADLAPLPVIGQCAPGVQAVRADLLGMLTDNLVAMNKNLPEVTASSPAVTDDLSTLGVSAMLVSVRDPATLERIRTFLATTYAGKTGGLATPPQTFGEVASVRAAIYLALQNAVLLVVVLTLIAAAASLAIAVTGGILERKRPFTLLRLSGTATPTLYRVVLLESVVPLIAATLVAAATGLAVALPLGRALTGGSALSALPSGSYYVTLSGALLVSLGVLLATMPIIKRVTVPANIRFE
jgi:hypothetical protein